MLRILHTSDWHLGHTLHDIDRSAEHAAFLDWLLDQLAAHAIDALVIAGDVFDTANPPAAATAAWYGFLAAARARCPGLDVVVVAGNHDAPSRIDAPGPVLASLGVSVVGSLPRRDRNTVDVDRLVVPLHDASGAVAGWCGAVPFLRPGDLPSVEAGDPLIEGVRAVYRQVQDAVADRCGGRLASVLTGHAYLVGGQLSERSERVVLGGNQHALPVDVFDDTVGYVALGHLHRAQRVGGRDGVRYCGSPIPLALDERSYRHQVVVVAFDGAERVELEVLEIPRTVDIVRVPPTGEAPPEAVLEALTALPPAGAAPDPSGWPFLEVHVALDQPEPGLRARVQAAVEDRAVRLARLRTASTAGVVSGAAIPEDLADLSPEEVFLRRWASEHEHPPDSAVLEAFAAVLHDVHQAGG